MAVQFQPSEYYTRGQIRALLGAPTARPEAPSVSVAGKGQTYIDLAVTPPDTPGWATSSPYIVGYTIRYVTNGVAKQCFVGAKAVVRLDGLLTGALYAISVAATDYLGKQGTFSAVISEQTALNLTPPAAPTLAVTALVVGVSVQVTSVNTEPDFAGYDLYQSTSASIATQQGLSPVARFRGPSFVDLEFTVGGNYYFLLRAANYSGVTADSNVIGPVTVTPRAAGSPAPLSMATATATANADGSITFVFPASSDPDLQHYNIYRQMMDGLLGWVLIGSSSTNTYQDTTAILGETYQYSASVVNSTDESSYDTLHVVSALAQDTVPPVEPMGNIQYAGVLGGVRVSWSASPDPNVAHYLIRWRYTQVGAGSVFSAGEAVTGTSFTIQGLIDPVTGVPPTRDALANQFEAEIAAVDSSNRISAFVARLDNAGHHLPVEYPELYGYSPADNSIPPSPTLTAPSANSDGTITLKWEAPGVPDQAGFVIERRTKLAAGSVSAWERIQTVTDPTPGTKQYTDSGLQPYKFEQTEYRYLIRTRDNSGNLSGANLLEDPSFITGGAWAGGGVASGSGFNNTGSAQRVDAVVDGNSCYQALPIDKGNPYTLSAYCKRDGSAAKATLAIVYLSDTDDLLFDNSVQVSDTWQRFSVTAVAPAWATSVVVILAVKDAGTSVLFSNVQFEQGAFATPFGDSKTAWLRAVDTVGPPLYNAAFTVTPVLGGFVLNWTNGTSPDYFNCTYEILRGPNADSLVKVVEVAGTSDGKANMWSDSSPDVDSPVTYVFALRARDRWGNVSNSLLGQSAAKTSLTTGNKGIPTQGDVANAAASAAAAMSAALAAQNKILVVTTMPTPISVGAGNFVYLTVADGDYAPGLYESNGASWTQGSVQAELIVGKIVAGQIAAGAVTTEALATTGLFVGGGENMPGSFRVVDDQGNTVGYIGKYTANGQETYGGWFKKLQIGGTVNLPQLAADSNGNVSIGGRSATAISDTIQPGGGIDFSAGIHSNAYLVRNNLIDASWWTPGAAIQWNRNIAGPTTQDVFVSAAGPDSSSRIVWQATAGPSDGAAPGGGWNAGGAGNLFAVDHTKTYMFVCYQRQVSGVGNGYWGPAGDSITDLNTTNIQSNPYFAAFTPPVAGRWFLFIGWVYPSGATGFDSAKAGVWDCATGLKVGGGASFNWAPGATNCATRAYQYYSNGGVYQFASPAVYLCDGHEPTLDQLLAMGAPSARNPITSSNVSTYIEAQAINGTTIADNSISTPKLIANSITASKLTLTDPTNICMNGSGNSGTDGWEGGISSHQPYLVLGETAILSTSNRDANYGQCFSVNAGETYSFSVWCCRGDQALAQAVPQGGFSVGLQMWSDAYNNGEHWLGAGYVPEYSNSWQRLTGQVTIPTGKTRARIWVQINANVGNTGVWAFTALVVRKAASAELLVDGTITSRLLNTAGLEVGGAGSKPVLLKAVQDDGAVIGQIGKFSQATGWWGAAAGGWFKNLGIGGSIDNPNLGIDSSGFLRGKNGATTDPNGNLMLKNILLIPGTTNGTYVQTNPTDLAELGSANANMSVTLNGNPCLIGFSAQFSCVSAGGYLSSIYVVYGGHYANATLGSVQFSVVGDGAGATINYGWSDNGDGTSALVASLLASGGGYSWASVVQTAGPVPTGNEAQISVTVVAATPQANQKIYLQLLAALTNVRPVLGRQNFGNGSNVRRELSFTAGASPVPIVGPLMVLTDSAGNASLNYLQLFSMPAGDYNFRVQAYGTTSYPTSILARSFQLAELG